MEENEARRVLGVGPEDAPQDIQTTYGSRLQALEARAAAAPTEALRGKFTRQIEELTQAYGTLRGAPAEDLERDLPLARRSGGGPVDAAGPAGSAEDPPYRLGVALIDLAYVSVRRAACARTGEDMVVCLVRGAAPADLDRLTAAWRSLAGEDFGFDSGELHGQPFLAFRATGGDLLQRDMDAARKVRRLDPVEPVCAAVAGLARKVAAAQPHAEIRDLRGDTVWRTAAGELLPLGLGAARGWAGGAAAAEQVALGRLAWELLTNRPAAEDIDLSKARPEAPAGLVRAVGRSLAERPDARFPTLEAMADAFGGRRPPGIIPAVLAQRFPALEVKHLAAGAIGLAAVVALVATYPAWKSATPWQGASNKQEAARLAGVVKIMAARADTLRAGARRAAEDAAREANRLQEKLEGVGAGDDYDEVLPRYVAAGLEKTRTAAIDAQLEAAATADAESAQLRLAEAESLLESGDTAGALDRYRKLEADYRRLSGLPGKIRATLAAQEAKTAARLAGAWADKDCQAASRWSVVDGALSVDWPGQGRFRERVIGVDTDQVFTIGEAPDAQAGRVFSYRLEGDQMTAQELGARPTSMRLKRC